MVRQLAPLCFSKVLRGLAMALCFGALPLSASESGDYSYQGQRYFQQGRYREAWSAFSMALDASRKEADLSAEGRIRIALSTLSLHAREYSDAEAQLAKVRESQLDLAGRLAYAQARLELLNAQQRYTDALAVFEQAKIDTDDSDFDMQVATVFGEASVAAAGADRQELSRKWADKSRKLSDDEAPGLQAWLKARRADVVPGAHPGSTVSVSALYAQALTHAIGKRYFAAGTILQRLGELAEIQSDTTAATDFYERAAAVFEQLGLVKPYKACAERLVALQGESSPYRAKLESLP